VAVADIEVNELDEQLQAGARLIDVREPDEYTAGHVPGAVSIPLATVPDHLDAFRGSDAVYVICQGGGRSRRAAEFVADHGIEAINVAGGTGAWVASGRDTVAGEQPS
jgi:rhodanese-related sulfurtransferase